MRVIVVAHGELDGPRLRELVADGERPTVICADGGASGARSAGVVPDLVIGDGDSLDEAEAEALRRDGVPVRIVSAEKDESDTELCLREAIARGASEIVLVGALGGPRVEHGLANIALLALPELGDRDARIEHGRSAIRMLGRPDGPSRIRLDGQPGDFVSLLPVGDGVEGVTTEGMRYPLSDEPLPLGPARGLSNELLGTAAAVSVGRGRMLVVHTRGRGT